jgi:hypothetical protein
MKLEPKVLKRGYKMTDEMEFLENEDSFEEDLDSLDLDSD